jgi:hypothetical protein
MLTEQNNALHIVTYVGNIVPTFPMLDDAEISGGRRKVPAT